MLEGGREGGRGIKQALGGFWVGVLGVLGVLGGCVCYFRDF